MRGTDKSDLWICNSAFLWECCERCSTCRVVASNLALLSDRSEWANPCGAVVVVAAFDCCSPKKSVNIPARNILLSTMGKLKINTAGILLIYQRHLNKMDWTLLCTLVRHMREIENTSTIRKRKEKNWLIHLMAIFLIGTKAMCTENLGTELWIYKKLFSIVGFSVNWLIERKKSLSHFGIAIYYDLLSST